jgi:hypothetical protein
MQRRLSGCCRRPRTRPVEQAKPQDDRGDVDGRQQLPLHVGNTGDHHPAGRVGEIERVRLRVRLAAGPVGKPVALRDEPARASGLRPGDQVTRTFGVEARICGKRLSDPRLVELFRQVGELVDDDFGARGDERRAHRRAVKHVENGRLDTGLRQRLAGFSRARRAGDVMPSTQQQRR